jgi:ATP-dependent DNA helicase RecQ
LHELIHIHGVGEGKAKKYGADFVELISQYVIDNEILRPDDLVVKSTGIKSAIKLYIIQNVDRKLSLDDIAKAKGLTMEALLKEMEQIVYSGTKLNIKYWIDEMLDDEQQEEIHDYFMESESDKIEGALKEFEGDYDIDELRLMRIKFISEVARREKELKKF